MKTLCRLWVGLSFTVGLAFAERTQAQQSAPNIDPQNKTEQESDTQTDPKSVENIKWDHSDIKRFTRAQTQSKLPVPRYVALKYGRVNARKGPGPNHAILWQYQRRGMPLIVVAEMDVWRKVRDVYGDESWIRTAQLTSDPSVMTVDQAPIFKKPNARSYVVAVAEPWVVLTLEGCQSATWCRVKSGEKYKGFVEKSKIWGAEKF